MQMGDVQAAEDLASDVMLKMIESIKKYTFRGLPFGAWVFRIARNRLIDLHRRRKRRGEVDLSETLSTALANPQVLAERALERGQLQIALKHLTGEQRQVIVEARSAAAAAATTLAAGALFEAATRITTAEARISALESTPRAEQPPGGGPVEMVNPLAELTLDNGRWVAVKATHGRYDQASGLIDLSGRVELFHDDVRRPAAIDEGRHQLVEPPPECRLAPLRKQQEALARQGFGAPAAYTAFFVLLTVSGGALA